MYSMFIQGKLTEDNSLWLECIPEKIFNRFKMTKCLRNCQRNLVDLTIFSSICRFSWYLPDKYYADSVRNMLLFSFSCNIYLLSSPNL